MRILIFNQTYPDYRIEGLRSSFVEARINHYKKSHEVKVLKANGNNSEYFQNGVFVKEVENIKEAEIFVNSYNPDAIFIHFVEWWMLGVSALKGIPTFIWVHGSEALGWWRVLFSIHKKNFKIFFTSFMFNNMIWLRNFRKIVNYSNKHGNPKFIFVSNWMRKIATIDTLSSAKHYQVIPNPIDDKFFHYTQKNANDRLKILLIRSFNGKKYGNDISINAILILKKEPFFSELRFSIFGEGLLFDELTDKIKDLDNVTISKRFLSHKEIKENHDKHGIFLCPTRMDAQGVSMCEAMSSGLVPIASNNTAIPEFVTNGHSGILANNSTELANAIKQLYYDEKLFIKLSKNAAISIRNKCAIEKTISKELELLNNLPKS